MTDDDSPGLDVGLFDLIKAFGEVLERIKSRPVYEIKDEEVSVSEMVVHLRTLLAETQKDKPLFILRVMEQQRSRRAMICLFLAVLEMVKAQSVHILQPDLFGEIALAKGDRFDESADEPPTADLAPGIDEEYK
jgi:segregation and condensation protein A